MSVLTEIRDESITLCRQDNLRMGGLLEKGKVSLGEYCLDFFGDEGVEDQLLAEKLIESGLLVEE